MSAGKEMFDAATTMSAGAALMILRPWAFYVAATIATLRSHPEGMRESATNWRSADKNGVTTELDSLVGELNNLKKELKDQGKWEGGAFDTFEEVHGNFLKSVEQLKNARNDAGDAVDSNANFHSQVAVVALAIAIAMVAWGLFVFAARWLPAYNAVVLGIDAALGKAMLQGAKKILTNNIKAALILTGVIFGVITVSEMTAKSFPTVKAMPNDMSALTGKGKTPDDIRQPFTNDGLEYDKETGQLMPKTNLEI